MSSALFIKDVTPEMLEEILNIESSCFSMPWTLGQLQNQMNAENCTFLAATDENDAVMGYVGLMTVLDEGYISNVAVSPKFRRQGVADKLIAALIKRSAKDHAFLTLEVRESNLAAISLYKKHGFIPVGIRKNYYDRPKENAILMTLFFRKEEDS